MTYQPCASLKQRLLSEGCWLGDVGLMIWIDSRKQKMNKEKKRNVILNLMKDGNARTALCISQETGFSVSSVNRFVEANRGECYIFGWLERKRVRPTAVYKLGNEPDAPMPAYKKNKKKMKPAKTIMQMRTEHLMSISHWSSPFRLGDWFKGLSA